jgi:hypothetical protein
MRGRVEVQQLTVVVVPLLALVEVQQLTVVVVPLLALEFCRRQLSPIRLWLRKFLRALYTAKRQYENYSCPGLLSALITSFSTTAICPH